MKLARATRRESQVIGVHFFNPGPMMKLVEVIRGLVTSDATYQTVKTLSEKLGKIQFRSEFYSVFNHMTLGGPTNTLNNRNFGRIMSGGGARVVQFALRYQF